MAQIICLSLAFWGIIFFLNQKYVYFLLIATFIAFNGFGLFGLTSGRTNLDAYIFMGVAILIVQLYNRKTIRQGKQKDKVGTCIILLLVYTSVRTIFSILLSEESPVYSIKVLRTDFFMLSYFLFIQIPNQKIKKYLKILVRIIIVVGVVYSVFFFERLSTNQISERLNYTAMLALSAPLLFLLIFDDIEKKYKTTFVFIYVVFLFLLFSRGILLATAVAFSVYFLVIRKDRKAFISLILLLPLFYFLFSLVDNSKSEKVSNKSTFEEIEYALSLNSYDDFEYGSFGLRFAMVWERIDYVLDKPKVVIWGIGSIHEDSPSNKFNFMVGSYKETNMRVKQMIDTDDVAILSHWFRYGIVWLILFLYYIITSFKEAKKRIDKPFMITVFLTLVLMSMVGFSNDFFSEFPIGFFPLILLSRIYRVQIETPTYPPTIA